MFVGICAAGNRYRRPIADEKPMVRDRDCPLRNGWRSWFESVGMHIEIATLMETLGDAE